MKKMISALLALGLLFMSVVPAFAAAPQAGTAAVSPFRKNFGISLDKCSGGVYNTPA